eukprot:1191802-Prorocentrum_minimum.AAC.4
MLKRSNITSSFTEAGTSLQGKKRSTSKCDTHPLEQLSLQYAPPLLSVFIWASIIISNGQSEQWINPPISDLGLHRRLCSRKEEHGQISFKYPVLFGAMRQSRLGLDSSNW